MQKKGVIIWILIAITIAVCILAGILYSKNLNLGSENNNLIQDKNRLTQDVDSLNSKLSMLQEDVAKIYKTCINENACKGHYPGVRWNCNNVGDETNVNPSHICVCNSACSLNATEIKQS